MNACLSESSWTLMFARETRLSRSSGSLGGDVHYDQTETLRGVRSHKHQRNVWYDAEPVDPAQRSVRGVQALF